MTNKEITVICGENEITYYLTKKSVKNINLRIKEDGTVKVSAPHKIKQEVIDEFVRSKYDFIVKSREEMKERADNNPEPDADDVYCEGKELRYLGTKYTLKIEKAEDDEVVTEGRFIVARTIDTENLAYIKKMVNNWYYNKTRELFKRLNEETYSVYREYYNVPKANIQIKSMKSRWGCCYMKEGKIVMNSRLIYYPEMSVRYVFIHEYAHFMVPGHDRSFYRIVGRFMNDYKRWSDRLKRP